jgi:hypothetical protein
VWVIRDRLTIGARTGPAYGLFSRPGRGFVCIPATLMGLGFDALRSVAHVVRVGACFRASSPRAVLPFARRGILIAGILLRRAIGCGFWVLAPQTSRAVRSVGPARAFVHRNEIGFTSLDCLELWSFLGTFSGLWPPLLEPIRLWLFARRRGESAGFRRGVARVLWRIEGPATCFSCGVSAG